MKNKRKIIIISLSALAAVVITVIIIISQAGPSVDFEKLANEMKNRKPASAVSVSSAAIAESRVVIEVEPEKQKLIGLKTIAAAYKPLKRLIKTTGRVELDEKKIHTVNAKVEGYIEKLYLDFTGKYIARGEALVEIYSPELLSTQNEFINILKWAKDTDKPGAEALAVYNAARNRLKLWDISEAQIKKIEETRTAMRTLVLYSPAGGFVISKMATSGMKVMPGEKLFDIADLSVVWVTADIYENDLPLVKTGLKADITFSHLENLKKTAAIEYINPLLSADARAAKIRLSVANKDFVLKPQMVANIEIAVDLGKKLLIPKDAVIDTGKDQIVYVEKSSGLFELRKIKTGHKGEEETEVLSGLKAGDKVVFRANFLLDSEAQLKGYQR